MNILTMVMRSGLSKDDIQSYICISNSDYSFVTLSGADIVEALKTKKYAFTNIGVTNGIISATNGSIDKYTFLNASNNKIEGKINPVVLQRVEGNGKLIGYVIFNTDGVLQEITVAEAMELHSKTPFCNGKTRHTQQGDIIASIAGNYNLKEISISDHQVGKYTVELVFVGSAIGLNNAYSQYAGVILNFENAADLSRMYKKLREENRKIISSAVVIGATEKDCKSLAFKRVGASGIYGVYPIGIVIELIKRAGGKLCTSFGDITIGCLDYTSNEESSVTISNEFDLITGMSRSNRTAKFLKTYAESVISEFKAFKIEKK